MSNDCNNYLRLTPMHTAIEQPLLRKRSMYLKVQTLTTQGIKIIARLKSIVRRIESFDCMAGAFRHDGKYSVLNSFPTSYFY